MFNLQGSEIIFILLLALVVLGPEKLPGAIRRVTRTYAELRKLSSGFQEEFKSALDEPMREMRSTADLVRDSADPKRIAEKAEREAEEAAAAEKREREIATVAAMETVALDAEQESDVPEADVVDDHGEIDEIDDFADPIDEPEPDGTEEPAATAEPESVVTVEADLDDEFEERTA